jgi:SAM-dependent methyltransferase
VPETFSEQEQAALAVYEQLSRDPNFEDRPVWADAFSAGIFDQRSLGSPVLDVGCGSGRFITVLEQLQVPRQCYFGVDPSSGQIALARRLHPGYKFEIGSLYDVGARYPSRFGAFACNAVLMHLPRERLPVALRSLRASLMEGAVGMVAALHGTGQAPSPKGVSLTLYEVDELTRCFESAGFEADFYTETGYMAMGSVRAI